MELGAARDSSRELVAQQRGSRSPGATYMYSTAIASERDRREDQREPVAQRQLSEARRARPTLAGVHGRWPNRPSSRGSGHYWLRVAEPVADARAP